MFIIDDIISELVSQGIVNAQDKLNRSEKAVKILKKFNLKSDEPPADFDGVYIDTLIEYGITKPKIILELFRKPEIKSTFQEAFEQNNPNLLLEKTEDYLDSYFIGSKLIGFIPLPFPPMEQFSRVAVGMKPSAFGMYKLGNVCE